LEREHKGNSVLINKASTVLQLRKGKFRNPQWRGGGELRLRRKLAHRKRASPSEALKGVGREEGRKIARGQKDARKPKIHQKDKSICKRRLEGGRVGGEGGGNRNVTTVGKRPGYSGGRYTRGRESCEGKGVGQGTKQKRKKGSTAVKVAGRQGGGEGLTRTGESGHAKETNRLPPKRYSKGKAHVLLKVSKKGGRVALSRRARGRGVGEGGFLERAWGR